MLTYANPEAERRIGAVTESLKTQAQQLVEASEHAAERVASIAGNLYGQLLVAKLVLFGLMLALAASNRFRLTPALGSAVETGQPSVAAMSALRRSLLVETGLGLALIGVVAVMGTLPPPASL